MTIMAKATVYAQPDCPWCDRAKRLLGTLNYEYEVIMERHPDWPTVPYVIIDGNPVGGFTELARHVRR